MVNETVFLKNINFSSFRSSPFWVGCFERKNDFDSAVINNSIRLAYKFFKENKDDFFVVSALAFGNINYSQNSEEVRFLLSKAIKYNLINPLTDEMNDYFIGDSKLLASSISISFNKRAFLILSKLVMECDDVLGEVYFFINIKLGIAIYPHEDTGFGVISLTEDKTLGIEFLEYCKKNKNFNVYIDA